MRRYLFLLFVLCISAAFATSVNFAWDPGENYPPGVTYDLYANEATAQGITGTTQSLDVTGSPGEPLSAGVRAVPPAGYQCGDPLVECHPSAYATLDTVIPGQLAAVTPEDPAGLCATATDQGGEPMTATVTGTPVAIALSLTATPGAQNITVPADAEGVVVFWAYWLNATGYGLTSMSSTFSGTFTSVELAGTSIESATGISYAAVTSTGAKTITPVWNNTPSEGPTFIVAFVKGINTADWVRDTGLDSRSGETAVSATVDSATTDLVLSLDQKYDAIPGLETGWTSLQTQSNGSEGARLRSADSPGASTTTATIQNPYYSTIAVISIKEIGGAATETGEITESVAALATHGLTATARPDFTGIASASHTKFGTAAAIGAISRQALAQDLLTGRYIGVGTLLGESTASALQAATASALSDYRDSSIASETPPSRAQAIAYVIAQALAADASDADLGTITAQLSEGATTSDVFNAVATAYAALALGVQGGEQWVNNVAAGGNIASLATAAEAGVGESLGAQDGTIEEPSQALSAFLASVNALAGLSQGVSAQDVAVAIVAASSAISEATMASDVYDTLSGDTDRALSEAAAASDASHGGASALAALIAGIFASDTQAGTGAVYGVLDNAASGADAYQATLSDLERAITEGATAGAAQSAQASVYNALVEAISAATAINAQVASIAGFVAGALAGDSFSISDVEDARLERLYIAAISVTRAIDATLGISNTISGSVSIN